MNLLSKKSAIGIAFGALIVAGNVSAAPIYQYVGSWFVDQGPVWSAQTAGNYTTPVYSGVEAAAAIFGGSASDYAISTLGNDVNTVNNKAFMDGWADPNTYGYNGPAAENLHIDINNDGLYATPFGFGDAYSAFVSDHSVHLENFAFKIIGDTESVPEPSSLLLAGLGLAGIAAFGKMKKRA